MGSMKCYGGVKSKMNTITTLFSLACISSSVLGDESFHGMGSMKCYGDMSITLGGQDDKGYGDCDGTIWYEYGDLGLGYCDRLAVDDGHQTRLFSGYATCDGLLNIQCSMLSGCHG